MTIVNSKDLHWLAGLLEGEGSFMSGPPSRPHKPILSLEMTDKDIVHRAASILGDRTVTFHKSRKVNWKDSYYVCLKGAHAVEWMKKLRDLMGERRAEQIDKALKSYKDLSRPPKLSDSQVREIRKLGEEGLSSRKIEKIGFGVSHVIIHRVLKGTIYKYIE